MDKELDNLSNKQFVVIGLGCAPIYPCIIHMTPDVFGKERRKAKAGKEGKLGVEGMKPEIILEALRRAGATFENDVQSNPDRGRNCNGIQGA